MKGTRNVGLDIMRATAIAMVVFGHMLILFDAGRLNSWTQVNGFLGVEVFFVLSGFLIGRILIRTVAAEPGVRTMFSFWGRRWMRTLPAYWVVAIFLLFRETWNPKNLYYFAFLQNALAPELNGYFFGVSWSLAIEEWFYFLIPIVLTAGLLLFPRRRTTVFFVACGLMILGPLAVRVELAMLGKIPWWNIRQMISGRMDAIGFGVAMAAIREFYPELFSRIRRGAGVFGVAAVLVVVATAVIMLKYPGVLETRLLKTVGFSCVPLVCALLLPKIESIDRTLLPAGAVRVITFVSLVSYSTYLAHWEVLRTVLAYNPPNALGINTIAAIVSLTLIMLVSYVLYIAIEKPFMAMRDRLGTSDNRGRHAAQPTLTV